MLGSLEPPGSRHPPLLEAGGRYSHLQLNKCENTLQGTGWTLGDT